MIEAKSITHFYGKEAVLHDISLTIEEGSFTVLSGESGSGKSTLLSILSTLLRPSHGRIYYDQKDTAEIKKIDAFRNANIGFVFQFHYLIAHLTLLENIMIASRKEKAEGIALLERLGIKHLAHRFPDEISGGERQRAAIARALINEPRYLFADEPTGNLDTKNSEAVFDLLRELDTTVVVATHDTKRIASSDNIIRLKDGRLC